MTAIGVLTLTALGTIAPTATAAVACTDPVTSIPAIQGSGETAAITGAVTIRGVVVGDFEGASPALRGFYLQEAEGDDNPATSDGIFVFDAGANLVSVGQVVEVTGIAAEFQGQTQVTATTPAATSVTVCSSGATVKPVKVRLPVASPTALEAFEGMLVTLPQKLTVTEHFQLGRFGQVVVSHGGRLEQPTAQYAPTDPKAAALQASNNLSRLIIDDATNSQNPDPIVFARGDLPLGQNVLTAANTLRGGDTVIDAVGVMTYTWGGNAVSPNAYRVRPIGALGGAARFTVGNPRPTDVPAVGGSLKVASSNLLNYFNTFTGCTFGVGGATTDCRGAESAVELQRQAAKEVAALTSLQADVIGIMEIENDGYGPTSAIADLVGRLNAATAPGTWAYVDVDAAAGRVNAAGTDAIKVAVLYRPSVVTPVAGGTHVYPTAGDFERNPVAQTFTQSDGGKVTVVVNHLKSKGCDGATGANLDAGDGQGCFNARRTAEATALATWIKGTVIPAAADPDVLIIGDLNSYAKEDPIATLRAAGYRDMIDSVGDKDPYSYVFDGQWGYLDHALASKSLRSQVTGAGDVHINADEPSVLDYNVNFKTPGQVASLYAPDRFRNSDHDPVLIGLSPTS
jgi:predicted extracellular nuclease